jgi:hypothetical protein
MSARICLPLRELRLPALLELPLRILGKECRVAIRRRGHDMTIGVGNLVALICIVISIIFAIVTHQATNAVWWALLAIFAVLLWGAKAPWGRS